MSVYTYGDGRTFLPASCQVPKHVCTSTSSLQKQEPVSILLGDYEDYTLHMSDVHSQTTGAVHFYMIVQLKNREMWLVRCQAATAASQPRITNTNTLTLTSYRSCYFIILFSYSDTGCLMLSCDLPIIYVQVPNNFVYKSQLLKHPTSHYKITIIYFLRLLLIIHNANASAFST